MKTFFLLLISMFLTTTIFSQAGTLDPSFGNGGMVHYYYEEDIGSDEIGVGRFNSLAEQPDGKILATGLQSDDDIFWFDLYSTLSMRFNANGSLDSSLSPSGFLQNCAPFGSYEEGVSVAIQPDGNILMATEYSITRNNADGTCNESFGTDGGIHFYDYFGDYDLNELVYMPDGHILVFGNSYFTDNIIIIKLNSDGTPDSSFNDDAVSILPFSPAHFVTDVAIAPGGKFFISGHIYNSSGLYDNDFFVAKVNANGNLIASFGSGGIVTYDFGNTIKPVDVCNAMALQDDGKIILAGYSITDGDVYYQMAAIRMNADGSLDNTFSTDGKVLLNIGSKWDKFNDVVIQPDGKILLAGYAESTGLAQGIIVRLNTDGSFDESWSNDGIAENDSAVFKKVLLLNDDNLLAVGGLTFAKFLTSSQCSSAPSGLFATNITNNKAKLNWTADAGALKYKVQYRASTSPVWISLNATTNLKALTGLSANTTYKYRVRSQCSATLVTAWSNVAEFTTLPLREGELNTEELNISIYPNPAGDKIYIEFNETHESPLSIHLYDMTGKLISIQILNAEKTINVKELNAGMYFVEFTGDDLATQIQQIIIE